MGTGGALAQEGEGAAGAQGSGLVLLLPGHAMIVSSRPVGDPMLSQGCEPFPFEHGYRRPLRTALGKAAQGQAAVPAAAQGLLLSVFMGRVSPTQPTKPTPAMGESCKSALLWALKAFPTPLPAPHQHQGDK